MFLTYGDLALLFAVPSFAGVCIGRAVALELAQGFARLQNAFKMTELFYLVVILETKFYFGQ